MANNTASNNPVPNFYRASAADFKKIPGAPIAYWVSQKMVDAFSKLVPLSKIAAPRVGLSTSDTARFVRAWYEVSLDRIGFDHETSNSAKRSHRKWFPLNKGGEYRKWYGNNAWVLNYANDGEELKNWLVNNPNDPSTTSWSRYVRSPKYYFRESVNWSKVTSYRFGVRYSLFGFVFSDASNGIFGDHVTLLYLLGVLNSAVAEAFLEVLSPTLNNKSGDIAKIPISEEDQETKHNLLSLIRRLIDIARSDWDSYETSWDFTDLPLLRPAFRRETLAATYVALRSHWREMTLEMQRLEEENNRIFIDAYGLQDELTPDVPLEEITLTCNPHYRYSNKKTEEELEALLLADTMREFISYAVGCMFGRYSLDKPGLILANQGETFDAYLEQVPNPTFMPDKDNVIPILDGNWFEDDIVDRFKRFLLVTFGDEHYQENLAFIEKAIGKDIRKYFLKDFYANHFKRYKKRPIYWLFSSPKGSFNTLIYMHRYTPDTVSIVLNDYLREFRTKLTGRKEHLEQISISGSASSRDKSAALREIEKLKTTIAELEAYEIEILYPLATQRIQIDLDDGVKVNYNKFGKALKKIDGLSKA